MSIVLTEAAKSRIATQMDLSGETVLFFCATSKGCGGNGYQMGFITPEEVEATDLIIDLGESRKFVVDAESMSKLAGTVVDYVEDGLSGSFKFENPNAAGSCGCGNSFHTEQACS